MKETVKRLTVHFLDLLGHKHCEDDALLEAYLLAKIENSTLPDIRCCLMELTQDGVLDEDKDGAHYLVRREPEGRFQEYFRLNDKVDILFTLLAKEIV